MQAAKEVELLVKLGEGAYGSVFKGRILNTNEVVAVKVIRINADDEGISSTTLREITILKKLNHENIVKYCRCDLGSSISGSTMRLQTPKCSSFSSSLMKT